MTDEEPEKEPHFTDYMSPHIDEVEEIPRPGDWGISAEEIRAMDPEQFKEFVIGLQERIGRIYELERARYVQAEEGKELTAEDVFHILDPESVPEEPPESPKSDEPPEHSG